MKLITAALTLGIACQRAVMKEPLARYYTDCDVVGLVQAIQKMVPIENENKLDIFKDSISLPGLTQRSL